ncbi:hypothetical protein ES703_113736 [subsurface metagenome]
MYKSCIFLPLLNSVVDDNWNHHREFITRFELFPVGPEHIFKQPEHHPFVGTLELDKNEDQDLRVILEGKLQKQIRFTLVLDYPYKS